MTRQLLLDLCRSLHCEPPAEVGAEVEYPDLAGNPDDDEPLTGADWGTREEDYP